jgi:hypothetical protein
MIVCRARQVIYKEFRYDKETGALTVEQSPINWKEGCNLTEKVRRCSLLQRLCKTIFKFINIFFRCMIPLSHVQKGAAAGLTPRLLR